jgi:type 2 lantibiotic biosynthesis protein LanM
MKRTAQRHLALNLPTYLHNKGRTDLAQPFAPQTTLLTRLLDTCGEHDISALLSDLEKRYPLSPEAAASLRGLLHQRLMQISAHLIGHEFRNFKRHRGVRSLTGDARLLARDRNDELASEFLTILIAQGLPYLRSTYPVWARLIDEEIMRWYHNARELLVRLSTDMELLKGPCALEGAAELVSIEAGGDRHRGGQCVFLLTFAGGRKVVYKPRSLALDAWYSDLLAWLSSSAGSSLDLFSPRTVDRGAYGWSAFVEHVLVEDEQAETRFYTRLGMLLGLWTLLGGGDCHYENIIAHGEHPVIIDAETLFDAYGGVFDGSEGNDIGEQLSRKIADSAKRVGILPRYLQVNQSSDPIDLSALGMRAPIPAPFQYEDSYKSDARSLGIASAASFVIQPCRNMPRETREALGKSRIKAVCTGFEELYEIAIQHKRGLVAWLNQLKKLPNARVRMVMRQTNLYSRLLEQSLYPEYLRWGAKRSIELDRLSKRFTDQRFSKLNSQLSSAETGALETLDIPLFDVPLYAPPGTPISCDHRGHLSKAPSGNPLTSAMRRIQRVCPQDKYFQSRLIEEILVLDDVLKYPHREPSATSSPQSGTPRVESLAKDAIMETVTEVERHITTTSFRNARGEMGWLAPIPTSHDGCYEHRWTGNGLYAGSAGIAILYAALFKVSGNDNFRDQGIASISPLNNALLSRTRSGLQHDLDLLRDTYAVGVVSKLLGDTSLIHPALSCVKDFNPKTLEYDSTFDVLGGAAGALLSIMSLHRSFPSHSWLGTARMIGDHLVASQVAVNESHRAWKTLDAPLTGFAHGASGIALALLRLSDATGDTRYASAAFEALAYESASFNPAEGNWPDLRNTTEKGRHSYDACAWCHGATGIGLARIALEDVRAYRAAPPAPTQCADDIARARQATLSIARPPLEHLCCGAMGRATFLDLLAKKHCDSEAALMRDTIANSILKQPVTTWRMIRGVRDPIMVPGFFNGMAGVGYELLRMYVDSSLPCVLTWEGCD